MEEEQGGLESFLEWAAGLGISDSLQTQNAGSCLGHSLVVSHFHHAGGRGLGAVRDLRKGELILIVPKSALFTSDSILKDEKLSVAFSSHPSLSPTQILAVCLLYEMNKGKSSWWHPYLMHLPRGYDILATFGGFEKQALQVDDAMWTAEKAASRAKSEWKEAKRLMEELMLKPHFVTFRAWLWALGTISSRTLHIPWDQAGCLCPVGDLFNYAAPDEEPTSIANEDILQDRDAPDGSSIEQVDAPSLRLTDGGFNESVAAYCFYAKKNYKKGEQVLLSYGTYSNLELLEHYGFLLDENPNDKVFIPLEYGIYTSVSWPRESLYIHPNGKPSFALMSALRLWTTPPHRRRSVGHLAYSGSQLSVDNEMSVMKWISKKCQVVLKNLPTSVDEDSLLLSSIDKIQDFDNPMEWAKIVSNLGGDACNLLEDIRLENLKSGVKMGSAGRTRSLVGRWKLAVQWRFMYKNVLLDCISYCTDVISSLSTHCLDHKNQ